MDLKRNNIEVFARSNLASLGRDEDGEEMFTDVYYIVAEFPNGKRLAHHAAFPQHAIKEGGDDEWGPCFYRENLEGETKANALVGKIVARGVIDPKYWSEIEPAYGTHAHCCWEQEQIAAYGRDYLDT